MTLTQSLKAQAIGFDQIAIAPVGPGPDHERYTRWLEAGYAGEMSYLFRHAAPKLDPRSLLPDAQSIILVALNYAHPVDPALRNDPARGQIASYALGDDYHDVMRSALIKLDGWLRAQTGRSTHGRVFVDSAPMLERSWAMQAGLGFIGKNTCLISPESGSWLLLGGLLVPETLEYNAPPTLRAGESWELPLYASRTGTCGRCTRCLDVCPTNAFVAEREMDARRCISYLTIEQRGEIPLELRPRLGNWVFGCDLCQDVCPWNRRAAPAAQPSLRPRPDRVAPPLLDLLALDRAAFGARFRGSAILRARWEGFLRNVCVAAGNWGHPDAAEALSHHLHHSPTLVAVHAAWALGQLADGAGRSYLQSAWDARPANEVRAAIADALRAGAKTSGV